MVLSSPGWLLPPYNTMQTRHGLRAHQGYPYSVTSGTFEWIHKAVLQRHPPTGDGVVDVLHLYSRHMFNFAQRGSERGGSRGGTLASPRGGDGYRARGGRRGRGGYRGGSRGFVQFMDSAPTSRSTALFSTPIVWPPADTNKPGDRVITEGLSSSALETLEVPIITAGGEKFSGALQENVEVRQPGPNILLMLNPFAVPWLVQFHRLRRGADDTSSWSVIKSFLVCAYIMLIGCRSSPGVESPSSAI